MNKFEPIVKAVHDVLRAGIKNDPQVTVVTIFSIHDGPAGQWIIGDPRQDRHEVAKRLRTCADILDSASVLSFSKA